MSVTHYKRQKQVRVAEDDTWDKGRGSVFLDKKEVGYILHKGNMTVSTGTGLIFMNLNILPGMPVWPAYQAVTYTEWYIPGGVLIQFDSPDDERCVARNM